MAVGKTIANRVKLQFRFSSVRLALGSFDKPETVHDGPDPSNDKSSSGGLTPCVHEGHALELVAIAASGEGGTPAGGNAVQNEAALSALGGELDHGGFAA